MGDPSRHIRSCKVRALSSMSHSIEINTILRIVSSCLHLGLHALKRRDLFTKSKLWDRTATAVATHTYHLRNFAIFWRTWIVTWDIGNRTSIHSSSWGSISTPSYKLPETCSLSAWYNFLGFAFSNFWARIMMDFVVVYHETKISFVKSHKCCPAFYLCFQQPRLRARLTFCHR